MEALLSQEKLRPWAPWREALEEFERTMAAVEKIPRPEPKIDVESLRMSEDMVKRFTTPVTNKNQKLLVYIMHEGHHPFLVMRRTEQNDRGKYVTREEFLKVGLAWPNPFVASRDEMALKLGQAILDEAGV